jgi:hypothetical protein
MENTTTDRDPCGKTRNRGEISGKEGLASGLSLRGIDNLNAATAAVELNVSVDQGIEREIGALTNPLSGVEFVSYLANENVSGSHRFSAESLDAATLRVRVTSVSAGALSFFVCHEITSLRSEPSAHRSDKRTQNILLAKGLHRRSRSWHTCPIETHRVIRRTSIACESLFLAANPVVVNPCENPVF